MARLHSTCQYEMYHAALSDVKLASQTVNISATATMPFHGNSIALYGSTGTNHGIFNVSLDGVVPLTLNGTAPVSRYGVLLVSMATVSASALLMARSTTQAGYLTTFTS